MKPHPVVPGTQGYAVAQQKFTDATLSIDFMELHKDFIPFLPQEAGRVLDIGAGIGRDAAILAGMGHRVTAIEPVAEFRAAGKERYAAAQIEWIDDALPALALVRDRASSYDFILASGVWHHLDPAEQFEAMQNVSALLTPKGIFALSLRNGPAGAGSCVFPTHARQTARAAEHCGLSTLLLLDNQPSIMPGKERVSWARLVLQQQG